MTLLAALLPWIAFGLFAAIRLREPPELGRGHASEPAPRVSVIVPARNEAHNIGTCVGSLVRSEYPDFEIVVVDDRSEDGTADIVRAIAEGNAHDVRVLPGEPLPDGWFGKPWACWQGAQATDGDLLLFTDADTTHGPELLTQAVADLENSGAQALSLLGDQIMGSFWERVVQPQMFFLIALRYPNQRRLYRTPLRDPRRKHHAIANGQYILVRREAYDAIDGHRSVQHEVVEDLRLAQNLVGAGQGLVLRDARSRFATRMYRSLGELVAGWSKNVWTGARQAVGGTGGLLLVPVAIVALLGLWVLPALVLSISLAGAVPAALPTGTLAWAAIATGIGALFWSAGTARFGAPWYYGLASPLGAAVTAWILLRSMLRGRRIEWKGRAYGGGPH